MTRLRGVRGSLAGLGYVMLTLLMAAPTDAANVRASADAVPGVVVIRETIDVGSGTATTVGSGLVLSSSGLVLTNNHLIQGATRIAVTDTDNGHTYPASPVGYDVSQDIAVLQLQGATGLPTAPLGDSRSVKLGDVDEMVGNLDGNWDSPYTLTLLVKALNQTIVGSNDRENDRLHGLIETSVALPDNVTGAGGPLVNPDHQVVGLITAKTIDPSLTTGGPGFSIPINTALSVAHRITTGQSSTMIHVGPTASLGVTVDLSCICGNPPKIHLLTGPAPITHVYPNTPAAQIGLKPGDKITSFNGHTLSSPGELSQLLLATNPGQTVSITWMDLRHTSHTSHVRLASGPPQ